MNDLDLLWKKNIYQELIELSDIEIQKKLWLGKCPGYICSFVELYNTLFEDFRFDLFIKQELPKTRGLPQAFMDNIQELREIFDNYNEDSMSDEEIINDPKWIEVVNQAKKVREQWELIFGDNFDVIKFDEKLDKDNVNPSTGF